LAPEFSIVRNETPTCVNLRETALADRGQRFKAADWNTALAADCRPEAYGFGKIAFVSVDYELSLAPESTEVAT
jgi:hypothetical protein